MADDHEHVPTENNEEGDETNHARANLHLRRAMSQGKPKGILKNAPSQSPGPGTPNSGGQQYAYALVLLTAYIQLTEYTKSAMGRAKYCVDGDTKG